MRSVQNKVVEKIETHRLLNNVSRNFFLRDYVEKYGTAKLATDDNTIRYTYFACRIKWDTHTQVICNTCCSSTAKIVTRTRLNIRLYYSSYLILYICHSQMHSHVGIFFYYINYRLARHNHAVFHGSFH